VFDESPSDWDPWVAEPFDAYPPDNITAEQKE